jgi:glycosyltransferase involved in cell wall biosynthesis
LRIALLDSWLQQVSAGSGTAAAIGGLGRALQRRGHRVTRLAPWRNWPAALILRRLLFNLQLPALLQQLDYDLIVGFDIDGFLWSGRQRVPYVCSVKGVIAEELQHERGIVRRQLAMLAALERINARRAPLVLTTSDYCRQQIGWHYGVPAQRVKLVPEGIDLAGWQARLAAAAVTAPAAATILCVARQYPRKHIADLLRAMAPLHRRQPAARLLIVGDGPEHGRLRALAGELGLGAAAQFTGALSDAEMAHVYRRSRLFCLPSVQEGFGIVFLEAMAAGLPIVATTAAAIPEVVPQRQAGILVAPGDVANLAAALDELLSDPQLAAEYGAFGREHVQQFDWDRVAEQFEQKVKLHAALAG